MPKYELSVRIQDQGSPSRAYTTDVIINVLDVNDNKPQFYTQLYEETITEEGNSGQRVRKEAIGPRAGWKWEPEIVGDEDV